MICDRDGLCVLGLGLGLGLLVDLDTERGFDLGHLFLASFLVMQVVSCLCFTFLWFGHDIFNSACAVRAVAVARCWDGVP